jgi:conjugal transfer pilus assembly protein TraV
VKANIIYIFAALLLMGCSTILNPYKSEFACSKEYDNGKCMSIEEAYKESVQKKKVKLSKTNEKENKEACKKCQDNAKLGNLPVDTYCSACLNTEGDDNSASRKSIYSIKSTETLYQREVNKKLIEILKAPNTPLISPPRLMRVLIFPYKGDQNELYMMRYVYFIVDDARWVVGNYLIETEE